MSQLDVRQYYFKIMRLVFKASELDLAQIGFKGENAIVSGCKESFDAFNKSFTKFENEKKKNKGYVRANAFIINSKEVNQNMANTENIDLLDIKKYQKILIALNYQYLLNKTLKYSLQKLAKKGGISDYYLRDFIEKFIPLAYFRIPIFRDKFLKLLQETFVEEDRNVSSNDVEASNEQEESCRETGDEMQLEKLSKKPSQSKTKKSNPNNEIEEWFRIEFPKKDIYKEKDIPCIREESK